MYTTALVYERGPAKWTNHKPNHSAFDQLKLSWEIKNTVHKQIKPLLLWWKLSVILISSWLCYFNLLTKSYSRSLLFFFFPHSSTYHRFYYYRNNDFIRLRENVLNLYCSLGEYWRLQIYFPDWWKSVACVSVQDYLLSNGMCMSSGNWELWFLTPMTQLAYIQLY